MVKKIITWSIGFLDTENVGLAIKSNVPSCLEARYITKHTFYAGHFVNTNEMQMQTLIF